MKEENVYVFSEIEETIHFLDAPLNETLKLFLFPEQAKDYFDKRYNDIISELGNKNEILFFKSKSYFQVKNDECKYQGVIKKYRIEDNKKENNKVWVYRSLVISSNSHFYERIKVFGNKYSASKYYDKMSENLYGLYSSEVFQYYLDKDNNLNG